MTSTPTKPVDNVVIAPKGLQDRNTNIIAGTTVENKGKLIQLKSSHRCKNMIFFSITKNHIGHLSSRRIEYTLPLKQDPLITCDQLGNLFVKASNSARFVPNTEQSLA